MKVTFEQVQTSTKSKLDKMIEAPQYFPAWANTRMLKFFKQAQDDRFASENTTQGDRWAPLSPKYAEQKAKVTNGGILFFSGRLAEAASMLGKDSRKIITNNSAIFSIQTSGDFQYPMFLQLGIPGRMQARPFSGLSPETVQLMIKDYQSYLVKGIFK